MSVTLTLKRQRQGDCHKCEAFLVIQNYKDRNCLETKNKTKIKNKGIIWKIP